MIEQDNVFEKELASFSADFARCALHMCKAQEKLFAMSDSRVEPLKNEFLEAITALHRFSTILEAKFEGAHDS